MNKKALISSILSVLLLSSCAAAPSETAGTEQETISIEETASETTPTSAETEQTTVTTTAETTAVTTEETVPETAAPDLTSIPRSPYMTADIADYGERFCDWRFDSTASVYSAADFLAAGGTKEMLSAAEAAVKNSEIWKQCEKICNTAKLSDDGVFHYDSEYDRGIMTLSSKEVDENGHALINFNSAVVRDFDGDGKTEAFIIMTIPDIENIFGCTEDCAVYVSSSGEAQFLTYGVDGAIRLICYDGFTHAQIYYGCNNSTTFANIYAAENDKARLVCEGSIIDHKEGLALLEIAPQAPGVWLIVWDNIDKIYKKLSPDRVTEELAERVFASEEMETIRKYVGEDKADLLESSYSLSNLLHLCGGKYITVFSDFGGFPIYTLEITEGNELIPHDTLLESDERPKISADLFAAEEMCAPAPIAPDEKIEAAPYTVTEKVIYRSSEELIEAGGESLLNAAVKAAKESGEYKKLSYRLSDDEKDSITPVISAAAYTDFDGDGAKEAFITMYLSSEEDETPIACFISSDGKAQLMDTQSYYMQNISEMSVINYGKESHILLSGNIYSVRNGIPIPELSSASPDENGKSFNRNRFYSTALGKYCYAKYSPLSEDILKALRDYLSTDPVPLGLPEKAWICGDKFIVTDSSFNTNFIYENGSFTYVPIHSDDDDKVIENTELYCYEVSF